MAALVAAGAAGAWAIARGPVGRSADQAAAVFAAGWSRDEFRNVPFSNTTASNATTHYRRLVAGLDNARVDARVVDTVTHGERGVARVRVRWPLSGAAWSYTAKVGLTRHHGGWAIRWQAADINPRLHANDRLELTRIPAPRGQILGGDRRPLVEERPVVDVGVEPARVRNIQTLTTRLSALLGVDATSLARRIQAARRHAFVDVITLRRNDYAALRPRLHPLPGTVFTAGRLPLAPTRTFARALLGSVGPATAEVIDASQGRLRAGDLTGLSGLEAQYDQRLAGRSGLAVEARRADGSIVLFEHAPIAGVPVSTTLDERVQRAADAALAGVDQPSALVALDIDSGDVEGSQWAPTAEATTSRSRAAIPLARASRS